MIANTPALEGVNIPALTFIPVKTPPVGLAVRFMGLSSMHNKPTLSILMIGKGFTVIEIVANPLQFPDTVYVTI